MYPSFFYGLLLYGGLVNCFGFFIMGLDKRKAKKAQWRIPESSLFLVAVLGGSAGAYLGMQVFRHKTRHAAFRFGIPIVFFLQVSGITLICLSQ